MADQAKIQATIEQYTALFSARDRDGWLSLWADGATMEDPVGTPVRKGKDEIGAMFDAAATSADSVELRLAGYTIVAGNEATFAMEVRPTLGGQTMILPAIDVMTFDDDARIVTQRAFVDFAQMRPAGDTA